MKEFKLRITEKHLDLGIEAVKTGVQSQNCVLAQAAKEFLPDFVNSTSSGIGCIHSIYGPIIDQEKVLAELVNTFDSGQYETVRSMLPLEIEFRLLQEEEVEEV